MKVWVMGQGEVSLTKRHFVGQGGEGDVYVRGDVAFKLFHDPAKCVPASKVRELAAITDDRVIKPEAMVMASARGPAVGYTMPFVRDAEPMCRLFPRAFKDRHGLDAPAVHDIIQELAQRVRSVHAAGALIVDLNEMNFLVRLSTRAVFAIDADSYQTASHPATAIMPSIRDPRTLSAPFDEASDWFAFAVLAFQLLVGVHPFKGKHPKVKSLAERMLRGLSAFDSKVKLPPVAAPLNIIPDAWAAWLRATFSGTHRVPPPRSMAGGAPVTVLGPIPSVSRGLTSRELVELPAPILDVATIDAATVIALTSQGVFLGTDRIDSPLPFGAVLGVTRAGGAIGAHIEHGKLRVRDVRNGRDLETACAGDAVTSCRGRIYVKSDDKLLELVTHDVGRNVVVSTRWVAQVLPNATQLFDGVATQSLLGAVYVSVFPASGTHVQLRVAELDGMHLMAGRADGDAQTGIVAVFAARDRAGADHRVVLRIAADGRTYDVDQQPAASPHVASAVLDSGVTIVLRDDGDLDVFRSAVGATSRTRVDAALSSDVHLRCHHGQLLGTRGTRAHRLTSHGQTTRQNSEANVVQT